MNTRDRLLAVTSSLIDEYGVQGVGLDSILHEAGISKTTFYKYFESKDDVAIESIKYKSEAVFDAIDAELAVVLDGDPIKRIRQFLEVWNKHLFKSDLHGCLFVKICCEFPNTNDARHQAGRVFPLKMHERLIDMGKMAGIGNPSLFADQVLLILQGYATFKFIHQRPNLESMAMDLVEKVIASHVKSAGSGRSSVDRDGDGRAANVKPNLRRRD